ncbi:MAG: pyridoxamine 5'-phosphate oxidase family protein, partial [Blautia sp.]|nr:pyridoxamine 5'-phosphate oxidase family protein [Blautia sp.]
MFRKMRRIGQALPMEECEQILREASYGVLAVLGDDGYPYAVPVNHVYAEGKIVFHCAVTGHKLDAIRREEKVSFCVVGHEQVLPKERATSFLSVIAFGRAHIVEDEASLRRIHKIHPAPFQRGVNPCIRMSVFLLHQLAKPCQILQNCRGILRRKRTVAVAFCIFESLIG